VPGDWKDQAGWVDLALGEVELHPWSVVVLHDVADAALPRLSEFLTRLGECDPTWSREFPDECTPIRGGAATSSFDTLRITN
jgi:hypothetical protein